jgi:hypothetical protein
MHMAEKMTPDEARRILIKGGFSLTPDPDAHEATWTDGLPHDFNGWGPRTPDPDHPETPSPAYDLQWAGESATHNHHVWRFDGRRHHHH